MTDTTPGIPQRAPLILVTLILVAGVANLNLAVANVALPDIGKSFDASQTGLDLVAVGYSLGLAASVLWLGAIGDRYGRKLMILLGMGLSIPASLLAAWAPSVGVLVVARDPAWSRLFGSPIRLEDGTVLFTLKDAAQRILDAPAAPSSRVAAQRIIDAALHGGDMASTSAAVRLALLKAGSPKS